MRSPLKSFEYWVFCAHIDTYDGQKKFNSIKDNTIKRVQLLEIIITSAFSIDRHISKIIVDKGLPQEVLNDLRKRLAERFKDVPKIEGRDSVNVSGIQIADLVACAIRKELGGDGSYYQYIENKIRAKIEM